MLPAVGLDADGLVQSIRIQTNGRQTYKVIHSTSCILQSNALEDGHNYCPKHVELTLEI